MNEHQLKILSGTKFSLSAPKAEGAKGRPKFSFGVWKGNPNVNVYTNHPQDDGKKPIRLGLTLAIFNSFVEMVESIAKNGAPGESMTIPCFSGKPSALVTEGHLVAGKEQDGRVFVGVSKEGYKSVKFHLQPDMYHQITNGKREPLSPAEQSAIFAIGYMRTVQSIVERMCFETYEAPEPYNGGNKGGGGYGNRNGGGGGYGGSRSSQQAAPRHDNMYDDDLPM